MRINERKLVVEKWGNPSVTTIDKLQSGLGCLRLLMLVFTAYVLDIFVNFLK